jgi:hypothetical protein
LDDRVALTSTLLQDRGSFEMVNAFLSFLFLLAPMILYAGAEGLIVPKGK